jgi:hypothetical protein
MFGPLLLLILPMLSACSTPGNSDATVNPCRLLVVRDYSAETQRAVAAEIRAASDAKWPLWIVDYGTLRREVRACRGE